MTDMKNSHPHTGMQAVFASCLWINETFGNVHYFLRLFFAQQC